MSFLIISLFIFSGAFLAVGIALLIQNAKKPISKKKIAKGIAITCAVGVFIILIILANLASQQTPQPIQAAQVVATPTPEPTPTPYIPPPPEPKFEPTPEPTPPPPEYSIRQISNSRWRVIVPKGRWYDTGIPVVTGQEIEIEGSPDKGKFLVQVADVVRFNGRYVGSTTPGYEAYFLENNSKYDYAIHVGPDFRDTAKIKIDDEAPVDSMQFIVTVKESYRTKICFYSNNFPHPEPSQEHLAQHQKARQWASEMLQKIAIY